MKLKYGDFTLESVAVDWDELRKPLADPPYGTLEVVAVTFVDAEPEESEMRDVSNSLSICAACFAGIALILAVSALAQLCGVR